jgi:hypothetical protein
LSLGARVTTALMKSRHWRSARPSKFGHSRQYILAVEGPDAGDLNEFLDDFRRMAARGAAATVLALAVNLPKIVDKSSIAAAQDVE